jgi:hypothetical protein
MAKQDWTPFEVTQGHLPKLAKQGFMTTVGLAVSHVPEDPALPTLADRYVVTFMTFYKREFRAPLKQFFRLMM